MWLRFSVRLEIGGSENSTFVRLYTTSSSFVTTGGATSSGVSPFTDSMNKPFFNPRECGKKEDVAKNWIFAELSWILVYLDLGVLGFQLSEYPGTSCWARPPKSGMRSPAWGVVTGRVARSCACLVTCMEPSQSRLKLRKSRHTPTEFGTLAQKLASRHLWLVFLDWNSEDKFE